MLRNAHAEDLGPLCWATPQRFPSSPSFRTLTIYIPHLSRLKNYPRRLQLARLRPRQQAPIQPTPATYFLLASDPSATFFADPSQDSSPFYSRLTFGRPSSPWQTFPQDTSPSCSSLTFEQPTLSNRLARSFLRETTALPIQTISTRTQFDLRETSIKIFILSLTVYFCQVPKVLFRYSVLGAYCFLFRCSIFFCV